MADVIDIFHFRRRKIHALPKKAPVDDKIVRSNKIENALSKWGSYNGSESLERNKSKFKDKKDDVDIDTD